MKLLKLSIPVKVLCITMATYLVLWSIGLMSGMIWQAWYVFIELGGSILAALLLSHFLFDRPAAKLQKAMERARRGDVLSRAPELADETFGHLAESFNDMLSHLTDLSAHKIQAEHDLLAAQQELDYQKNLEEKTTIITETNRRLEQLVKDLSLLYDIGQSVNAMVDLDQLYANITVTLHRYLKIEEFAIMMFDEQKEELMVRAASGFADDATVLKARFRKGEGISGLVAETGRKMYIRDTSREKRFLHYKGERLTRSRSFLSLPLVVKAEVLGVINFGRGEVGAFSATDVKMLSLVAHQVALAVANARLYTKTRELSVKDDLTGVYNRRHFQQMLQMEWKRAVRFGRELSVIMLDVDHFKNYNDTHGHLKGDDVLRHLGKLLLKNLREVDTVARFGGEEFVLLLPDTDKHGAIAVAEKVRKLVEAHRFEEHATNGPMITISAGLSTFPDDVGEMEDLVDDADIALYRAKEAGRNRVVCYAEPKMAEVAEPEAARGIFGGQRKKVATT